MGARDEEYLRGERAVRGLMVWCAIVLFALGLLLLFGPRRVQDARLTKGEIMNVARSTDPGGRAGA